MPLVNTLRYLRLKNKWSQDFVAVETNICKRTLWYYEIGAVTVSHASALKLSHIYDIDESEIIGNNRKIYIRENEYKELFPSISMRIHPENSAIQFLNRPKLSLKEVHNKIFGDKDK